jgi:hypothetical protein
VVVNDPAFETVGDVQYPLVKFNIPSKAFTGYTRLLTLHPVVPSGTEVSIVPVGASKPQLYESKDAEDDKSFTLNEKTSATVLRYDPGAADQPELYVGVDSGQHAGEKAWVFVFDVETADGTPIGQFKGAVIRNKF